MFSQLTSKVARTVGLVAILGMANPNVVNECQSNALPIVACEASKQRRKSTQDLKQANDPFWAGYSSRVPGLGWLSVRLRSSRSAEDVALDNIKFSETSRPLEVSRIPLGLSHQEALNCRGCGFSEEAAGILKMAGVPPVLAREALLAKKMPLSEVAKFLKLGFTLSEMRAYKSAGGTYREAADLMQRAQQSKWDITSWELVEWKRRRLNEQHLDAWLKHRLTADDFHLIIAKKAIANPEEFWIALEIVEKGLLYKKGEWMKEALWIIARGVSERRLARRHDRHETSWKHAETTLERALARSKHYADQGLNVGLETAYAFGELNLSADDARRATMRSETVIGQSTRMTGGCMSSVEKATVFVDGDSKRGRTEHFIFKKEDPEKLSPAKLAHAGIKSAAPRFSAREEASKRINDLLGFDLVNRTECGVKDGQAGIYMEPARGVPAAFQEIADITSKPEGRHAIITRARRGNGEEVYARLAEELGAEDVRIVDNRVYAMYCRIVSVSANDPAFRAAAHRLQLFDLLTGQVDRHMGNYFIEQDAKGHVIGITAIDNELSFGQDLVRPNDIAKKGMCDGFWRKGVRLPPVVDREMKSAFDRLTETMLEKELSGLLTEAEIEATKSRLMHIKFHLANCEKAGLVIEESEWGSKKTTRLLKKYANHTNSLWRRDCVESPKYDKHKVAYRDALVAKRC